MRVLQICHKPPLPSIDGGCIAINNISNGLINEVENVKILTISTVKHPFDVKYYTKDFIDKSSIESVFIDTKVNIVDAFSNLVTYDSYNISRFFSPDFNSLIIKTLKANTYDIVLLESLFTTPYIETVKSFSAAKIILRSHNLEYIIWKRLSKESANPAKKVYLKLLSNQLKKYELDVLQNIDGIATISEKDKDKYIELKCPVPVKTIPFGIDTSKYKPIKKDNENLKFFHIGAMDWKPNLEAISWLLNDIWPKILEQIPNAELHLAGKNMPDWIFNKDFKNVFNHKEIEDASKFINNNDIMLVPLLSAGGIRVKIIEGMAYGKTIVSTTIGAEGLKYENLKNIIIADSPEEFSEAALKLFKNSYNKNKIGQNAREHVVKSYDYKKISKKLVSFFDSIQ